MQDIVVANLGTSNKIYLNPGEGGDFGSVVPIEIGGASESDDTRHVAVGDVNSDGWLDVVVSNGAGQRSKIYFGTGSAADFGSVLATPVGSSAPASRFVVIADVNGDSRVDLVFANSDAPNTVYLNDGGADWSSTSPLEISPDADDTRSIAVADVNGDGFSDFIAGNSGQQNVVYLSDGASAGELKIGSPSPVGDETDDTRSVSVLDVNGDGKLDIVSSNADATSRVYLNAGDGSFPSSGNGVGISAESPLGMAVGDTNSDGFPDLLVGNKLYLGDGSGSFGEVVPSQICNDEGVRSTQVADVNGDGAPDLVVGLDGVNQIYLNDGTGIFTDVAPQPIGSDFDSTESVVVVDMNGDGLLVRSAEIV